MFSVIVPYLSASFLFIGILFYLLKRSPAGWEDEHGFHIATKS
jgi:hypothetical protein